MPGIDGVRATAVSLVVLFHIYVFGAGAPPISLSGINLRPWFTTGFIGVDLFFVLSGFLLMLPWAKNYYEGGKPLCLKEYYKRRLMRIIPAYYVHLAILFLVMVPIVYSYTALFSHLGLATALAHLTFTQYLFPWTSAGYGINGALWTLTIEAMFYLVLPYVAYFFLGKKALGTLLIALLLVQGWLYLSFHQFYEWLVLILSTWNIYKYDSETIKMFVALQFPGQIFYFALGMAMTNLYFLIYKNKYAAGYAASISTFLCVIGLFGIMWLISRINVWHTYWLYGWHIIAAFTLSFLVLCAALPNTFSSRVLGAAPIRIIGLTSYSIYLWHLPVIYFVKTYFTISDLNGMSRFYFMLVNCIPLILVIAYLSYVYVELPFLRRREVSLTTDTDVRCRINT